MKILTTKADSLTMLANNTLSVKLSSDFQQDDAEQTHMILELTFQSLEDIETELRVNDPRLVISSLNMNLLEVLLNSYLKQNPNNVYDLGFKNGNLIRFKRIH